MNDHQLQDILREIELSQNEPNKEGEKILHIQEGCQNGEGSHKTGALENFYKGKICFNENYQIIKLLKKYTKFC